MQGFNMGRYRPYDSDPRKESFNARTGTHALGKRAHKADQGILVVRFELPFNVWCDNCGAHIGQGVRFNAEKKRIGEYYSTPIFSFKCKTACCQSYMVILTDPKNTRYVVESGARQQNSDWDPAENGGFAIHDDGKASTSALPPADAFSALEKSISDKAIAKTRASRTEELQELANNRAQDPYTLNAVLRSQFRKGRRERTVSAKRNEELRGRIGWNTDVDLIGETEADKEEGSRIWAEEKDAKARSIKSIPMKTASKTKTEAISSLAARLRANTGKRRNPF